ncbi:DUF4234 domain-containing protein [Solirubrobacter taibaiensis]|nr:DUF4234 domain-containing protein [Solirubrobacter taibaiensis]
MSTPMPGTYTSPPPPGFESTAVIRSVGRCVLLLILSCGVWGFAWIYHTTKEVSNKVNNPAPSPAFRTVLYFIPIANLVMWFLAWKDIEEYCKRARSEDFPMVLFYLLTLLLGFPALFTYPIIQSRMNQAHMAATNGQATNAPMKTIDWVFLIIGMLYWLALWAFIIIVIVAAAGSSTTTY